jgi:hypothetical protein
MDRGTPLWLVDRHLVNARLCVKRVSGEFYLTPQDDQRAMAGRRELFKPSWREDGAFYGKIQVE